MEAFLNFLLANLPLIICMIVGVALLIVEVFMPGFGLPGISGIVLLVISIVLAWTSYGALAGLGVTLVALALAGLAISISLKSAANGKLSKSALILKDVASPEENSELAAFVGKIGTASTVLRPAGIAEFDGVRLNVVSEGEFIAKGAPVRVEKIEGTRIVVKGTQSASL